MSSPRLVNASLKKTSTSRSDLVYSGSLVLAAGLALASICAIVAFVLIEALPFFRAASWPEFFFSPAWFPGESRFGAAALLVGTLLVVLGAIFVAVPIGISAALALVFYLPQALASRTQAVVEVIAGVPAVVVGLFGLTVVVPLLAGVVPPGLGLPAASVTLGMLLAPQLIVNAAETFRAELPELLRVARSLGISRETVILHLVLPQRLRILIGSSTILTGRAIGETLAVMMVAGNVIQFPESIGSSVRTLNATIALEMPYAEGIHRSALAALAALTFAVVLALRAVVPGQARR